MNTLLLILLGIAGFIILVKGVTYVLRRTVAAYRWIATHYRAFCARWRQRRPPPPPALTMPLTRWEEHDIPTWRRRGQPSPALDLSAPGTSPPPAAETKLPGRVVF
ncbi:MAG: hypothetical protein U1F76_20965 [Candidatus Competibacteraceae bacterium]